MLNVWFSLKHPEFVPNSWREPLEFLFDFRDEDVTLTRHIITWTVLRVQANFPSIALGRGTGFRTLVQMYDKT